MNVLDTSPLVPYTQLSIISEKQGNYCNHAFGTRSYNERPFVLVAEQCGLWLQCGRQCLFIYLLAIILI